MLLNKEFDILLAIQTGTLLIYSAPTECGSLRLATTKFTMEITENRKYTRTPREDAQDVNVENPNVGKTTAVHRLQTITMQK